VAKPFSIQSPEDIAKEYGGNKQKIAQAMQLGVVDATAGVLAGMFIDRMRSAQTMEGVNPPTVAQQVMGGAPASSPSLASPGGLGGSPQGAPPMAPPPGMGAPMPEGPPIGMAEGGIVGLGIPETMFDESTNGGFNDGYASGGLVAFARGGMSDLYDDVEYFESGGRQSAISPAGARGVMQLMPGTARSPGFGVAPARDDSEDENRRVGREYLEAMYRKYGDRDTALMAYNWGPGKVDKWIKEGRPADKVPSETRKYVANIGKRAGSEASARDVDTPASRGSSDTTMDYLRRMQEQFGPTAEEKEVDAARMARAKEMASPEYYEKERKEDMWSTLAQIGFNMASSKSPFLLQAVGEAAAAALPEARADKKERKALKDRALDVMSEMNGQKRKENLQLYGIAVDAAQADIRAAQADKEFGLKERGLQQEADLTREGYQSREDTARLAATSRDTQFDILYQNEYAKLKREAEAGTWKTPQGNKPSDDIIRYWASQHAMSTIAASKGGQGTLTPEEILNRSRSGGGGQNQPIDLGDMSQ
jgi:hypothetical protein